MTVLEGRIKMDNSKCAKCGETFQTTDKVVYCPTCKAYHHLECWEENGGCNNPDCEDYVGKPKYPWLARGGTLGQQSEQDDYDGSDNSKNDEKPKKRKSKKIKLYVFLGLYLLSLIGLIMCIASEESDNETLMMVGVLTFTLCAMSLPIYGLFLLYIKLFRVVIRANKENYAAAKRAAQSGRREISQEGLSQSTKIVNKVMKGVYAVIGAGILVLIFLSVFTCTFGHKYELESQPYDKCYDIYACKKCDDEKKEISQERKDKYSIDHSFTANKCYYCGVHSKDYLATVIKENAMSYKDGVYEISGNISYKNKKYNTSIHYKPSNNVFLIQVNFSLTEVAIVSFSKNSSSYNCFATIRENDLSVTTVEGTSYKLADSVLIYDKNISNSTGKDLTYEDRFIAQQKAEDMVEMLVNIADAYWDDVYISFSELEK
jgi:hypothetical protein